MVRNLIVFGTRPEAIKLAILIKIFQENKTKFETRICVTAQHREMLDQVLEFFNIDPDYDLNLMRSNQNLHSLTSDIIVAMRPILEEFKPHNVFVHGDTTTSMGAALAAFYSGIKICHIEAGLRTNNKNSPFPEEINRQITSRLTEFHFAPTEIAKQNLIKENISESNIIVTGNTVIDALHEGRNIINSNLFASIEDLKRLLKRRFILVTSHRRENHGIGLEKIMEALKIISIKFPKIDIVYSVHPNPNVKNPIEKHLYGINNIKVLNYQPYEAFLWLMSNSHFIITDSGGIQEEAPSLGKPVLILRDSTERPENLDTGRAKLVGTNVEKIVNESARLIEDIEYYNTLCAISNPYGEGKASALIFEFINAKYD